MGRTGDHGEFFVMEFTELGPEVVRSAYKHIECGVCGERPVARVGKISVRFTRKRDAVDWVQTAAGNAFRDQVADALTVSNLSGWRAGDIDVTSSTALHADLGRYWEFVVIGHTRAYTSRVKLAVKRECDVCGRRLYVPPSDGLVVPVDTWDGSDVFVIEELPGLVLVTDEFRRVVEANKMTGITLTPARDWRDPLAIVPW